MCFETNSIAMVNYDVVKTSLIGHLFIQQGGGINPSKYKFRKLTNWLPRVKLTLESLRLSVQRAMSSPFVRNLEMWSASQKASIRYEFHLLAPQLVSIEWNFYAHTFTDVTVWSILVSVAMVLSSLVVRSIRRLHWTVIRIVLIEYITNITEQPLPYPRSCRLIVIRSTHKSNKDANSSSLDLFTKCAAKQSLGGSCWEHSEFFFSNMFIKWRTSCILLGCSTITANSPARGTLAKARAKNASSHYVVPPPPPNNVYFNHFNHFTCAVHIRDL